MVAKKLYYFFQILNRCVQETRFLEKIYIEEKQVNSSEVNVNVEIIAVAHSRTEELKVFVQSWLNQTARNWRLHVIHDGESDVFNYVMGRFQAQSPEKISFCCTKLRYNDYGHSLRDIGIRQSSADYILVTNADNYYVPKTLEFFNSAISTQESLRADVVMFDMVHSHNNPGGRKLPSYSFFETFYRRRSIDIGAAFVLRELAIRVGFRDKTHSGDATYFEEILKERLKSKEKLKVAKIKKILLVHN